MARFAASMDILAVVSSTARWRSLIPVLLLIHSSEVSIYLDKSSFVTTVFGRQLPVPMILVFMSFLFLSSPAMLQLCTRNAAQESSSIMSLTCSRWVARYAFAPQNKSASSTFPFTALTRASVMQ